LGVAWVVYAGLAVTLAVRGWGPFGFERAAIDWSAHHRPPVARRVALGVTGLGSGVPVYVAVLCAGALLARGARGTGVRRRTVALLLFPVLWLVAGQLLRAGLMNAFARPRPSTVYWATTATGFSFPSGHSFSSAVCAGLVLVAIARRLPSWTRPACVVVVLYAVAVGLSRVYLGVHWPLDVLGAWLLATGWLAAGSAVLARVQRGRGDVPPPPPGEGTRTTGGESGARGTSSGRPRDDRSHR